MKNVLAEWSQGEGGWAGTALAHPPTTPIPQARPGLGTYVVCGCCRAGTTARANALKQIVPNSSSLYTLFYFVIYNSVIGTNGTNGTKETNGINGTNAL